MRGLTGRMAPLRSARDRRLDWRELGLTGAAAVVLYLLWHTPLAFPLRYFSVLVHECSHAIAGILTGGAVDRIVLNQHEGGLTFIHGGIPVIFGSAGYLGSILFGCLCLYLSRNRRHADLFCMGIGLSLAAMTLLFASPLGDLFGFVYGAAAGMLIALVGWKVRTIAPYFLKFLGVAVCLFGFQDIQSTLFSSGAALAHSDAGILAHSTGIPAILWALSWLAFSTVMFAVFAYLSSTSPRSIRQPGSLPTIPGGLKPAKAVARDFSRIR
ncbi:MAG TPA: M50 family metallopeptidase [Armatimonadota bacterium]|nr:M50 family metallopeptidase [Armatimonadota bacterium]